MAQSSRYYNPITITQTCRLRARGFEIVDGVHTGRVTSEAQGNYMSGSIATGVPTYAEIRWPTHSEWGLNCHRCYVTAPTADAIVRYRVYGYVKKGWQYMYNSAAGWETAWSTGASLYSGWRALPAGFDGEAFCCRGRWWLRMQIYATRSGYADSLTLDHYWNHFDGPKTPPEFPA